LPWPAAGAKPTVRATCEGHKVRLSLEGYLGGELFGAYRKAIAGAKFDPATKTNTVRKDLVPEVMGRLAQLEGLMVAADEGTKELVSGVVERASSDRGAALRRLEETDAELAKRGFALYGYQKTGVAWLAPKSAAVLADDMGLGKTAQALISAPAGAPIVVVCPAVAKGVWVREAAMWRPDLEPRAFSGRGNFEFPQPGQMVIVNYDILPTVESLKEGSYGNPAKGTVLIADEAHAVKTAKAARTKKFRKLSSMVRRAGGRVWLLTATPLLNKPPELWAMLMACGLQGLMGSWKEFCRMMGARKKYVRTRRGTIEITDWEHARPAPEVPERLKDGMLRRMKTEVLTDLPPKRYQTITVNGLDAKTRKAADKLVAQLGLDLETASDEAFEAAVDKIPFEEMSHLRKLLAAAKIPAMLEQVEAFEEAEEPLVVFCSHRAPVDTLGEREGWETITGDTPPDRRTEIENAFQRGELRGVAATIKAGGIAITLTHASNALFVDKDFTPALNAQAEDRIYRIGQNRGVLVTCLVADHALDRRVQELLDTKQALIEATVDAARRQAGDDAGAEDLERLQGAAVAVEEESRRAEQLLSEAAVEVARFEARLEALRETQAADAELAAARRAHEEEMRAINRRAATWGFTPSGGGSDEAPTERRHAETERETWTARAVATLTALNPDFAQKDNGVGWNKADQVLGHALAARSADGWTEMEWAIAARVVLKYHGQVGEPPSETEAR
jgi:superfamily II DNA or RNA helicase